MNFFSRAASATQDKSPKQPVPEDVAAAVSVMGEKRHHQALGADTFLDENQKSRGASPFLDTASLGAAPLGASASPVKGAPVFLTEQSPGPVFFSESGTDKKNLIAMTLGVTILVTLLGGGIVWYFTQSTKQGAGDVSSSVPEETVTIQTTIGGSGTEKQLPFSADTPNYLMVDIETVTAESFRQQLDQSGALITAAQMTRPVEFLLTDKNNNPIAFSRFAYLMKLALPGDLLAAFGESFSIFLYSDQGKARVGLALSLSDAAGEKLVTQKERIFPYIFRSLFFPGMTVPRESVFRSGVHNAEKIRFVNIDETQGLSFDFVLHSNEWLIGTSKDTLRAMLDQQP